MDINKYIGEKIRKFRQSKNITQEEIAEYLGITTQAVSRYELGDRKTDNDVLFKLADYFNISVNDFFPPLETQTNTLINDEMGLKYINISQLSIMTGVPVDEIKKIVNGNEKLPKPTSLIKIGNALHLNNENERYETIYALLISAGYVEDPQDEKNELYNTGIRYLLDENERLNLCKYLAKIWNQNTQFNYTIEMIYNTIFDNEKETYSNTEVLNMLEDSSYEQDLFDLIDSIFENRKDEKDIQEELLKQVLRNKGILDENDNLSQEDFDRIINFIENNKDLLIKKQD